MAVIKRSVGGMARVNIQRKDYLRGWYLGELRKVADDVKVYDIKLFSVVGFVFSVLGEYDVALVRIPYERPCQSNCHTRREPF